MERLLAVAEAMVDPLLVLTAVRTDDGQIEDFAVTYANPAYVRLYGAERWQAAGRRLSHLLPDLRGEELFEIYRRVTDTGEPHVIDEFPFEGVDADGSPKRYAIDLRIVRVDDGVAVTGREISGYLATFDALVASEERFRLLAERSKDVIFRYRTAPVATFEYVSPSIEALSGYTAQDLYGDARLAFAMVHDLDRPDFEARLEDGRLFREPFLARWVGKDGRVVWVEQTNTEILDTAGVRVAVEGVARDATQRVQSAADVATSEARFRSALDGIGLHAMIVDRDGKIVFTNQFVSRRSAWTRDELLGRDAIDTFIPAEQRSSARERSSAAIQSENAAEPWESTGWLATGRRCGSPGRAASSAILPVPSRGWHPSARTSPSGGGSRIGTIAWTLRWTRPPSPSSSRTCRVGSCMQTLPSRLRPGSGRRMPSATGRGHSCGWRPVDQGSDGSRATCGPAAPGMANGSSVARTVDRAGRRPPSPRSGPSSGPSPGTSPWPVT